jgi:type IV secretory pathway VirJ component
MRAGCVRAVNAAGRTIQLWALTSMRKLFSEGRRSVIVAAAALSIVACSSVGSAKPPTETQAALADLPIVEMPASERTDALAIILSGDGGWRAIEQQMTAVLTQANIGVVGLDSLRYFWEAKTPEQLAGDLERIITRYTEAWHVDDVLLVGYSFGADVLPAAINRMDAGARDRTVQISLLGPAEDATFEFHVGDWLGVHSDDARRVAPEAERLDMAKVQCLYGEGERDSLCRDPIFRGAKVIETPGGHHFGGDYEALAQHLLAGYRARIKS